MGDALDLSERGAVHRPFVSVDIRSPSLIDWNLVQWPAAPHFALLHG